MTHTKSDCNNYYFVNPHGHTTKGIKWNGLLRDGVFLTLQEVIDAAKKEFRDVPFNKLLLWPGHGTFVVGVSNKEEDQNLKTLADLVLEVEKDWDDPNFNGLYVISYMHGVFVDSDYI